MEKERDWKKLEAIQSRTQVRLSTRCSKCFKKLLRISHKVAQLKSCSKNLKVAQKLLNNFNLGFHLLTVQEVVRDGPLEK